MPNKRKDDYRPHIPPEAAPGCHVRGCEEPGTYKAPRSRAALHDYQWFCLDHIREHNARWDYFSGMEREEIESFIKDAVTGHRPTWSRESHTRHQYQQQLNEALYEFMHFGAAKPPRPTPPLSAKLRKALAVMDMEYPFSAGQLKAQYRAMVKKYHPDLNRGNKQSEERFKLVTAAYHSLSEHIKVSN
jgi:DnaJ-domain-containing protein 1